MSFLSRVNLNNLSTNTFHFSPLSTLSSGCLILPVPNIIRDMIQEIWMSSYGIRDHQTGISIVSANIGAIDWIANYQIYNRKKFMRLFQRYKTNMGSEPRASVFPPLLRSVPQASHSIFYGRVKNNEFKTGLLIGYFFTHYFIFGAAGKNAVVTFGLKLL